MDIHNSIMDIYNANMYIHDWIKEMHNWIMYIHDWIKDMAIWIMGANDSGWISLHRATWNWNTFSIKIEILRI